MVLAILLLVGAFALIAALALVGIESQQATEQCAKWDYRVIHQDAWTQLLPSGKVLIPIHHPASDTMQLVCVESR